MCLAQGPQRSDTGEARTRGTSVSSQALYHWATALPLYNIALNKNEWTSMGENLSCRLAKSSCSSWHSQAPETN